MEKFDIVLQGKCSEITKNIIDSYKTLPFVDNIVLSSYEDEISIGLLNDINFVKNEVIHPCGLGNRNLQINTSRNGIKSITSQRCIKMRTDQLIHFNSMNMMYNFWNKNKSKGKIFTLGMYLSFPYHPRDHIFWGYTEDLRNLFEIPYDIEIKTQYDQSNSVRSETYIGQYYYARFDSEIYNQIKDPYMYMTDNSPMIKEAIIKDLSIRDNIFQSFPRVDLIWPKMYNTNQYVRLIPQSLCEYWGDV